jgi:hypothetical protein
MIEIFIENLLVLRWHFAFAKDEKLDDRILLLYCLFFEREVLLNLVDWFLTFDKYAENFDLNKFPRCLCSRYNHRCGRGCVGGQYILPQVHQAEG